MIRFFVLFLTFLFTACASAPPNDGIPRVLVDGEWLLLGHTHGDDTLHRSCPGLGPDGQPKPGGCAGEFEAGVIHVLRQIQAAAQARQQAQPAANIAPVASPQKKAPQ